MVELQMNMNVAGDNNLIRMCFVPGLATDGG